MWFTKNRGVDDLVDRVRTNRLESLTILRQRQFGEAEAVKLAEAIRASSSLTELRCCSHDCGVEGARALGEAIGASPTMRVVDVGNAHLGDEGTRALSRCLRGRSMTTLDHEGKGAGDEGLKALSAELKESQLEALNVSRNVFGDEGLAALAAASSRLKRLDVSDNPRLTTGAADVIHPGLEVFVCRDLQPGAFDATAKAVSTLTHLDVSGCGLEAADVAALVPNIRGLREFRVARNPLTDSACEVLADAMLRGDLRFDVLDLGKTNITGRGLAAVIKARAVAKLFANANHLARDDISLVAAELVAAVDDDAPVVTLDTLGLCAVGLVDDGAEVLATALEQPTCTIAVFEVGGNDAIGDSGIAALCRARDARPGLDIAGLPLAA